MSGTALRRGDLVEVRSPAEILATLDADGVLDGLPFMPEMVDYCGRRYEVDSRAEKICDTITYPSSRRMADGVFLADLRCDGAGHGGCQAECRFYWKEAWLKRVDPSDPVSPPLTEMDLQSLRDRVQRNVQRMTAGAEPVERWRCQATEAIVATTPLRTFDPMQYVREVQNGDVGLGRFARVMARAVVYETRRKLGTLRPLPLVGTATTPLPRGDLNVQPGDWVRVKTPEQIAANVDASGRNRGLTFDREMLPFCGQTFQVRKRVTQIIEERTGEMIQMRNDCIMLEDVYCGAEFSYARWFCPRKIPPYWREAWLERVPGPQS